MPLVMWGQATASTTSGSLYRLHSKWTGHPAQGCFGANIDDPVLDAALDIMEPLTPSDPGYKDALSEAAMDSLLKNVHEIPVQQWYHRTPSSTRYHANHPSATSDMFNGANGTRFAVAHAAHSGVVR